MGRQNDLLLAWIESFDGQHIDIYWVEMNLLVCTLYLEYHDVRTYVTLKDDRPC